MGRIIDFNEIKMNRFYKNLQILLKKRNFDSDSWTAKSIKPELPKIDLVYL